ncbi:uncharacterized protein [Hyperolius riggenbachi]|uniref:uncharacterized protein isoform X2 n=1 Tax=Hyperolius riggenbachi TaxID=752182 RepID=UPI0035A28544
MDSLVQDIVGLAATEGGPELIAECLARAAGSRKATEKQAPKKKNKKVDHRSGARRSQSEPPVSLLATAVCDAPSVLPQLPSVRTGSASPRYPAMDRALQAAVEEAGLCAPLPAKRTRTQKRPYSPPADPPPTRRPGVRAEVSSRPQDVSHALQGANPGAEVRRVPALVQEVRRSSGVDYSPAGPSHPSGRAEEDVGRLPGAFGADSGDQGAGAGDPGRMSPSNPVGDAPSGKPAGRLYVPPQWRLKVLQHFHEDILGERKQKKLAPVCGRDGTATDGLTCNVHRMQKRLEERGEAGTAA